MNLGDIDGSNLSSTSSPHTAHLLSQISFLHKEVQRLENQLQISRIKSVSASREITEEYEKLLKNVLTKTDEWKNKYLLKVEECNDMSYRITCLEDIADIHRGEDVKVEANDSLNAIHHPEAVLAVQQEQVTELEGARAENMQLRSSVNNLQSEIKRLTHESRYLADRLNNPGVPASTQTESLSRQNLDSESPTLEQNVIQSIVYEPDEHQLSENYRLLQEERQRKYSAQRECEKMVCELNFVKQKLEESVSAEGSAMKRAASFDTELKETVQRMSLLEQERAYLETQLQQYEKDIEQLLEHKNACATELQVISSSNRSLQNEIRMLNQKESQLTLVVKGKEEELNDVVEAYKSATKENSILLETNRILEREIDNLRGLLSSKEESINFFRDQTAQLHQREQQLILDLQSFEYENDQLQRRVLKDEAYLTKLEHDYSNLQHSMITKDVSLDELHFNLAELSKQLVAKENESLLLRQHCNSVEAECSHFQASVDHETKRSKHLEDANARLVAKNIIDSSKWKESSGVETVVRELENQLTDIQKQLKKEQSLRYQYEKRAEEVKKKLEDAEESNERLHTVILEQTKTLSSLYR